MSPLRAIAIALVAVLLGVLNAAPATASSGAPSGGSIVGTWRTSTDGVRQVVTFAPDGSLSGNAGCNRIMSTYAVDGSSLDIQPIGATLMFCEGKMAAESTFIKALERSTAFSRDGRRLTLYSSSGKVTLTLRRR